MNLHQPNPPEFTVATFRVDGAWVFDISVDAYRGRIESIAQRQGAQITVKDEAS